MKTIVITGSNSGIGKGTAEYFSNKGWNVAATMRDPSKGVSLEQHENIKVFRLDVTDVNSVNRAVSNILEDYNHVDVVVNNAGYALVGPFEVTTQQQIESQFNTNVFGLMHVTRAFLPHFRKQEKGVFINISSLGGLITYPLTSLYHSTKWAIEGFSESLYYELSKLNIAVKLIEPGAVATKFSSSSMKFGDPSKIKDYQPIIAQMSKFQQNSNRVPGNVEAIAKGIYEAATDDTAKLRYPLGDAQQTLDARNKLGHEKFMDYLNKSMLGN